MFCNCILLQGQSSIVERPEHQKILGFDLDPFGLAYRYPAIKGAFWFDIDERHWITVELGYLWPDVDLNGNEFNNDFVGGIRNFIIAPQIAQSVKSRPRSPGYVAIGPYFQFIESQMEQSYFFNSRENLLTVHRGAVLNVSRYGVMPSIGIKLPDQLITLDFRLDLILAFNRNSFNDLVEPLTIRRFRPEDVQSFQKEGSTLLFNPRPTIRVGFSFNR